MTSLNIPVQRARQEEKWGDLKLGGEPYPKMNRQEEFDYCRKKYPEIPKTVLLKYHTSIRGVQFTPESWKKYDDNKDLKPSIGSLFQKHKMNLTEPMLVPHDFLFRDGTIAMFCLSPDEKDPYIIEYVDDRFWLSADGDLIEEIIFPLKPKYYGKTTSSGMLMEHVAYTIGTDMMVVIPRRYCHYFTGKSACKFCDLLHSTQLQLKMGMGVKTRISDQDVYETFREALKEEGRWRQHFLTGGSDHRNNFQQEFETYRSCIEAGTRAAQEYGLDRLPIYSMMAPLGKEHTQQLKEAGSNGCSVHIEVFGKEKFDYLCPGKAREQGYEEFMERMINSVEIYGPGNVQAGLVAGVELAYGYNDLQEAVDDDLATTEFLLKQGVVVGGTCLTVEPGSDFYDDGQKEPPLEFYCMLGLGRQKLAQQYHLWPKLLDHKSQHYLADSDLYRYI